MALLGRGFVGIWHGLKPGIRPDFDTFHTREHMPERLGIPGFLRGRRFMNDAGTGPLCFTLYEASHCEVFRSPAYLARLNEPTPETRRIQPYMTRFVRGACQTVLSLGEGVGGAVATMRMRLDAGTMPALQAACIELYGLQGTCGVHLGAALPQLTAAPTSETALRDNAAEPFGDWVLMVEALDRQDLEAAAAPLQAVLARTGAAVIEQAMFRLAFLTEASS